MLPAILGLLVLSLLCSGALLVWVAKLAHAAQTAGDGSLSVRCDSLEAGQKRLEELLRAEMAQNRRENAESLAQNREAMAVQISAIPSALHDLRSALGSSLSEVFGKQRESHALEAKKARDEVAQAVRVQSELLLVQHKNAVELQTARIEAVEGLLHKTQSEAGVLRDGVIKALDALKIGLREKIEEAANSQRQGHAIEAKVAREEAALLLQRHGEALRTQLMGASEHQHERLLALQGLNEKSHAGAALLRDQVLLSLETLRGELLGKIVESAQGERAEGAATAKKSREEAALSLKAQGEALLFQLKGAGEAQRERLETMKEFLATLSANHRIEANGLREGLATALGDINTLLREQTGAVSKGQAEQTAALSKGQIEQTAAVTRTLDAFAAKVRDFEGKTEATLEKMREGVERKLADLQGGNERKLEEMRATVDEKLQGTLEKRLGESFQLVSERLEQVQRGLGEMQSLANGVGDLKKVLSNVKTRGNWGEVQLGNLLEQVMAPEQFATNVPVTNGRERVEFAIKLPGRDDSQAQIWLPIDAKFPQETYARMIAAEEAGDLEARDKSSKELEEVVKRCASEISKKYISPPLTTDFAVLYLPTEGLYAEVVKRTGIVEHLHRECRVVIAGPTTIAALLNSLQMGFRTLEIQKNSSKINEVLVSVKTEFGKYALVLEKIKKNLDTAQNTVEEAQKRTRVLTRTLDKVEAVESGAPSSSMVLSAAEPVVEALELQLVESE